MRAWAVVMLVRACTTAVSIRAGNALYFARHVPLQNLRVLRWPSISSPHMRQVIVTGGNAVSPF